MAQQLTSISAKLKEVQDGAEAGATELKSAKGKIKAMAAEITAGRAAVKAMLEQEACNKVTTNKLHMSALAAVSTQYDELKKLTHKITNHTCYKGTKCTDLNCPHGEPSLAQIAKRNEKEEAAKAKARQVEDEVQEKLEAAEDAAIAELAKQLEEAKLKKKAKSQMAKSNKVAATPSSSEKEEEKAKSQTAKPNKVAATPPSNDKEEEKKKENEGSTEATPVPTVLTTRPWPRTERHQTGRTQTRAGANWGRTQWRWQITPTEKQWALRNNNHMEEHETTRKGEEP